MTQGLRAPGRCRARLNARHPRSRPCGCLGRPSFPLALVFQLTSSPRGISWTSSPWPTSAPGGLSKYSVRRELHAKTSPAQGSRREDPVGTRTGTHGPDLQGPGAHGATARFLPPLGWGVPARGAPFHRGDPDHTLRCGRMPRGTRAPCARNGPACGLRPRWTRQGGPARGNRPGPGTPNPGGRACGTCEGEAG